MALLVRVILLASAVFLCAAQPVELEGGSPSLPNEANPGHSVGPTANKGAHILTFRNEEANSQTPQTRLSHETHTKNRPNTAYMRDQPQTPEKPFSNSEPDTTRRGHSVHLSWRDQEANRTKRSVETPEAAPLKDNTHTRRRPHSVHISWRDQEANRTKRSVETPEAAPSNDNTPTRRRPHSVHISWRDQEANRTKRSVETPEAVPSNDNTPTRRRPHSVHISWRDQEANRTKRSVETPEAAPSNDNTPTRRRPHSVHISWREQEANTHAPQNISHDQTETKVRPYGVYYRNQEANRTKRSVETPEAAPSNDNTPTRRRPHSVHISWRDQEANRTKRSVETPEAAPSNDNTPTRRRPHSVHISWRDQEANRTKRSVESPEAVPSNDNTSTRRRPHSVHISWRDQEANRTKRSVETPEAAPSNDNTPTRRRPHSVHISWRDQEANRTKRSVETPEAALSNDNTPTRRRPHSVHISWRDQVANRTKRNVNTSEDKASNDGTHTKRRPYILPYWYRSNQQANRTKRSVETPEDKPSNGDTHTKRRPFYGSHGPYYGPYYWRDQAHGSEDSEGSQQVIVSWRDAEGHTVDTSDDSENEDHQPTEWESKQTQQHNVTNEDTKYNHLYIPIFWRNGPLENPNHQHHHDHIHHRREVLFRDAGKTIVLECRGNDRSKKVLKYSWLKNSDVLNLQGSPDLFSSNADGSHLSLKPVDANAGDYRCLTETSLGTASSRIVTVKKTYMTKPDSVPVNKYTPTEGAPFGLPCQIPDGYPKPEVKWALQDINNTKNQNKIMNRRILQSPDGTLWFSNVTQDDVSKQFKYVCLAKSPAYDEPVELAEATIDSLQASNGANNSELVEQYVSPDFVTLAGRVTEIYCIYGGTPLAHPDWSKDGVNVNGEPGDRVTRHNRSSGRRLVIHDTRASDQGSYTCAVDNGSSAAKSHSMTLTVEAEPTFTRRPNRSLKAKQGMDLTIPCVASGVPTPDVAWSYNGKPLAASDRVVVGSDGLTIKSVQDSDKGYYGCSARNSHGNNYAESAVSVV